MEDSFFVLMLVTVLLLCVSADVGKKRSRRQTVHWSVALFRRVPQERYELENPTNVASPVKTGKCRYGSDGNICGTEKLKQCENPYTNCVVPPKPKYAEGQCCYNSKESNPCRFGDDGTTCSTIGGRKCNNPGTSCVGHGFSAAVGKCCLNGNKKGRCPALQGVGTCPVQCRFDTDCPGKKKCCSNGCGIVCSDPVY